MSDSIKNWTEWLKKSRFSYMDEAQKDQTLRWLMQVRDTVLEKANIQQGDTLIDIGTGTGLLSFGAYEILKDSGTVIASDAFQDCIDECEKIAAECNFGENFKFLLSDATNIKLNENSVDVVVLRSVLVHILDKQKAIDEFYRILKTGGRISMFEPIISSNTKYHQLVDKDNFPNYDKLVEIENNVTYAPNDPLTNFNAETLVKNLEDSGFKDINLDLRYEPSTYTVEAQMVDPWFNSAPSPGSASLKQKFTQYLPENEVDEIIENIKKDLDGKEITVKTYLAFINAKK